MFMLDSMVVITVLLHDASKREVFISELAACHVNEQLLENAVANLNRTHKTITLTSALPGYEQNAVNLEHARANMNHLIFEGVKTWRDIDEERLLHRLDAAIKSQKAGNCYEFSFYTQSFFAKQGIKSEVFRIRGEQEDNHIFLIINRDPTSPAEDFHQWNDDALLVDPYLKKVYLASEIPNRLESCSYDSESNRVSYIPFDPIQHKLDNLVQTETVEDWRQVLKAYKEHLPSHVSQQATLENGDASSTATHLKK